MQARFRPSAMEEQDLRRETGNETVDPGAMRRYTPLMHHRFSLAVLFIVAFAALPPAASADTAGGIRPEVWIGGGVSYPEYHDVPEACGRGGIGAIFLDHLTLGVSAQADRDHVHYFADAGVILPEISFLVPYARFQYGRRDDRDDAAKGWAAGVRLEGDGISLYFEAHKIFEPEDDKGLSLGIWF
jgi:hypothetical protein